jgi:hypothetical protein
MHGPWSFAAENEIWAVDVACLPPKHRLDAEGRPKKYGEWLRTPLSGIISYIDRDDLPIEDHILRARVAVMLGCSFAIIADIERGELRVFQYVGNGRLRSSSVISNVLVRHPRCPTYMRAI